jgi:hypothetical protein
MRLLLGSVLALAIVTPALAQLAPPASPMVTCNIELTEGYDKY